MFARGSRGFLAYPRGQQRGERHGACGSVSNTFLPLMARWRPSWPTVREASGSLRTCVTIWDGSIQEFNRLAPRSSVTAESACARSSLLARLPQRARRLAASRFPAAAVELIQNFTLIHDVEDNDPERRHRPTVGSYGACPHAINSRLAHASAGQRRRTPASPPAASRTRWSGGCPSPHRLHPGVDRNGQYLDISYEAASM